MDRLEKLTMRAMELKKPHLKPWEMAMKNNPYNGKSRADLLEELSAPHDDWRLIVQALAWSGGG